MEKYQYLSYLLSLFWGRVPIVKKFPVVPLPRNLNSSFSSHPISSTAAPFVVLKNRGVIPRTSRGYFRTPYSPCTYLFVGWGLSPTVKIDPIIGF